MVDKGARELGIDPVDIRRRNLIGDDAYPTNGASGILFEGLSHHASLNKLLEVMDYDALKAERDKLRRTRAWLGLGLGPG